MKEKTRLFFNDSRFKVTATVILSQLIFLFLSVLAQQTAFIGYGLIMMVVTALSLIIALKYLVPPPLLPDSGLMFESSSVKEPKLLRLLIDHLPDYIYIKNRKSEFVTVNNATVELLRGKSQADLLGKTDFDFFPPDMAEEFFSKEQALMESDQPLLNHEETVIGPLGDRRFSLTSKVPFHNSRGEVIGLMGIGRDITAQKIAETNLKESQKMLQLIINNIPQFIFWKDKNYVYQGCNKNFAQAAGVGDPENIIGKTDYDLAWKKEEADFFREVDSRVMASGQTELHIIEPQQQADGKQAWLDTNKIPLLDDSGKVIGILGTYEDITERLQAEEKLKAYTVELERSNRELESFAYISSHDLQEPLRKIQTFSDRLQNKYYLLTDSQRQDYLARMHSAAARCQALIQDLLAYSRVSTQGRSFTVVDLNEITKNVLIDLELQIQQTEARIIIEQLPTIEADRMQMRQLFQNLIANALKFHHPGVAPVISVKHLSAEEALPTICRIAVSDNGIGFEEKFADRIFTVFQRLHNRTEYKGTGIGLAICRRIVERHGGTITATSVPGKGATFIITLPVHHQENT